MERIIVSFYLYNMHFMDQIEPLTHYDYQFRLTFNKFFLTACPGSPCGWSEKHGTSIIQDLKFH